ncbi:Alpha-1,6-mannosyl-glycoprotein 6-beta-N-acetylglucosaminyltransferase [Aphelenchoides besseyi]|nr:Alpha-1,6-mannosyl-glycoprotein 6-beta-N-acetylglucosaminyltransferase [Aphelenchoides besseyi]
MPSTLRLVFGMCIRQLKRYVYVLMFTLCACALIGFHRLQLVDETGRFNMNEFTAPPLKNREFYCGISISNLTNDSNYPHCLQKLEWMSGGWESNECYRRFGVNGSDCSFYEYISRREHQCPPQNWHSNLEEFVESRVNLEPKLEELFQLMTDAPDSYDFIQSRIRRLWTQWLKAKSELKTKMLAIDNRRVKTLFLYMGFLNNERGRMNFVKVSKSGGPLGELVQWSDLIAASHLLGYKLQIFTVWSEAKRALSDNQQHLSPCPEQNSTAIDLIFTDIIGLQKIKRHLKSFYIENWCRFRVLDSFGTHAEFNQPQYFRQNYKKFGTKLKSNVWGGNALNLQQFLTLYPHTDDNTFLGFVVETHEFESKTERQNITLVYGKDQSMWEDSADVAAKLTEIHGTVENYSAAVKHAGREFTNHGVLSPFDFNNLLRKSKVFLGLGFPIEGPAPLEAIASGAVFINPRFNPPKSRTTYKFFSEKPTMRKLTSQNPYLERFVGRPSVITVDIKNTTALTAAFEEAIKSNPEPKLPYEFSFPGFLERIDSLLVNVNFCDRNWDWPPFELARILVGSNGQSCQDVCRQSELLCERSFFKHINNLETLKSHSLMCSSEVKTIAEPFAPSACALQSDPYLFSCATEPPVDVQRLCPCVKVEVKFSISGDL